MTIAHSANETIFFDTTCFHLCIAFSILSFQRLLISNMEMILHSEKRRCLACVRHEMKNQALRARVRSLEYKINRDSILFALI